MRDITLGDTFYIRFTTRAFATGIPTTLGGTPVLSVYEENNLTQITSGVSITVDYDSVTGLNQATIVGTSGNGYESGKSYDLVITTGTVDSVSVVGEVVGSFTVDVIDNKISAALATDTYAELSAVPAATSTLADKINWMFALARNKATQTSTTKTLLADDESTVIASSTVSDDTVTFTRGEFS